MPRARPVQDYSVTVAAPDAERLAAALADLEGLARYPAWPEPSDARFLMRLGENLFQLAFPTEDTVSDFAAQLATALAANATLRLWLHAEPRLAMLPWEYLCLTAAAVDECRLHGVDLAKHEPYTTLPDPHTFLALHPHVSLVRQTAARPPTAALERLGALRVLVVWADPGTSDWPTLVGLEAEVASVRSALDKLPRTHVEARVLENATRTELARRVREWRPHVLHFAGHGGFPGAPDAPGDLEAPALVLEAEAAARRRHDYLTADELRRLCAEGGVQVVVLNACWGARGTPRLTGLAQALTAPAAGRPIPVVVAHQVPVSQSAAVGFAAPFYQNVVLACPLEDGVRAFRADCVQASPFGCGVPDWGVPVVFLSVGQSTLFRSERVDAYPLNFGEFLLEHVPLVGREFLRAHVARFRQDHASGVFLLTAPPGTGKTAFLAQYASEAPQPLHFFYRAAAGVTDPDECVRSLYHGLLGRHGILEHHPATDPLELRRRFDTLLRKVSALCQRAGTTELILLDGLDESGLTVCDGKSALDVLPVELPPHVYLLIASRPGPLADELARRRQTVRFDLDPSGTDNHDDAAAFCRRQLQGRVGGADEAALNGLCQRLVQRAKGNFLVLKLRLSKESLGPRPSVPDLEAAAEDLTGTVEQEYAQFFERVTRRVAADPGKLDVLYRVLGAFATALAPVMPEQVRAACGLSLGWWDWAFGLVSQFLERGGVRQEEQGALTYRVYHETFRVFLRGRLAAELASSQRRWAELALRWRELTGYSRLYALRHLPAHLLAAGGGQPLRPGSTPDELCAVLTDLEYLQAGIGADLTPPVLRGQAPHTVFDLLRDFQNALAVLPAGSPGREEVEILCGVLDRNSYILKDQPALFVQQICNERAWDTTPLGAKVKAAERGCTRPWLRLLNRPAGPPGSAPLRMLTGHIGAVHALAFAADGRTLASAGDDRTVRLWDAATGNPRGVLSGHTDWVRALAFAPDGHTLVSASDDGTVRLWDAAAGMARTTLAGHAGGVRALAFAPDGQTLASAGDDGTVRLWDAATGTARAALGRQAGGVRALAFAPDGRTLASAGVDGTLWLWDIATGARHAVPESPSDRLRALAFTADGRTLAGARVDGAVRLWDAATGAARAALTGTTGGVSALAFAPDGLTLASAGDDGTLRLWDAATGAARAVLTTNAGGVGVLAFAPDGRTLAGAGTNGTVRLWAVTGAVPVPPAKTTGAVYGVAYAPDGRTLAWAREDGTVELWDVATGAARAALATHAGGVSVLAFAPGGQTLASAGADATVRLWDTAAGAARAALAGHTDWVSGLAFTPDGQTLASAGADGTVRLWETATGAARAVLDGHRDWVRALAFAPDGRLLASAGDDGTVRLWDTATGAAHAALAAPTGGVHGLAFALDGRTWASAGDDGTLRVWDAVTGTARAALVGHTDWVRALAFALDGHTLASGGDDRTVRLWDAATGELLTWLPCAQAVLALWFDPNLPQLRVADRGGPRAGPSFFTLEIVRPRPTSEYHGPTQGFGGAGHETRQVV